MEEKVSHLKDKLRKIERSITRELRGHPRGRESTHAGSFDGGREDGLRTSKREKRIGGGEDGKLRVSKVAVEEERHIGVTRAHAIIGHLVLEGRVEGGFLNRGSGGGREVRGERKVRGMGRTGLLEGALTLRGERSDVIIQVRGRRRSTGNFDGDESRGSDNSRGVTGRAIIGRESGIFIIVFIIKVGAFARRREGAR
jgi:hypothetical protein